MKQKCVYRLDRKASRMILSEAITLLVRSAEKLHVAPCKVIQESLGFRLPCCGFRIPCLWIPDSTFMDFRFHNQEPGFWITIMVGFRIPLAGFRIPKLWIPYSTEQNYLDSGFRIPDSGLPYMGRFMAQHSSGELS